MRKNETNDMEIYFITIIELDNTCDLLKWVLRNKWRNFIVECDYRESLYWIYIVLWMIMERYWESGLCWTYISYYVSC